MFTFLYNLFVILFKAPSIIGVLKSVIDIIGSDRVKELLAIVSEVVQRVKTETPATDSSTETTRKRRSRQFNTRLGQRLFGISDTEVAAIQQVFPKNV